MPPVTRQLRGVAEQLVPIFRVADGRAAAQWYERLGFAVVGDHRFADGLPLYVFLRRGDVYLHLSEHAGDARPGTLVYFYVDDVDAIAAEFGVPVTTQPWAREIEFTDPDGNRLRIGTVHASD
jgi:catechol 2,3-dioxygenase-like lactoylglutathione lyase family enzyme